MKRTEKENNTLLYVLLGAAALLLVAAVVSMKLFLRPAPTPPTPPHAPEMAADSIGRSPALYQEEVHADSLRFGLGEVSLDALAAPLHRTVELPEPRTLRPGDTLETPHLRLHARTEKREAQGDRGGFRAEHLILSIENRSDDALAYRVDTRLEHPERCSSRGVLSHNAIAIAAHGRVERAECIYHSGLTVTVVRAETIDLPPLGYYYVSQLVPSQVGLEGRTAEGHAAPRPLTPCNLPFWREFASWGLEWADLIDFFARHDCQRYAPYKEYRFRTESGPLPAHR